MPPRTFDDADERHWPQRALQIWQILIGHAHNRQTITYKILSEIMGFDGAGVLNQPLGHIMQWCNQNKLPPLTALVVNEITGLPGDGLVTPIDLHAERELVFNHEWFKIYPPSPEELHSAFNK